MSNKNNIDCWKTLKFDILIHPWKTLKDLLFEGNPNEILVFHILREKYKFSDKDIGDIRRIIKEKMDISDEMAWKLEKAFWVSKEFWICLQRNYNEDKQRLKK